MNGWDYMRDQPMREETIRIDGGEYVTVDVTRPEVLFDPPEGALLRSAEATPFSHKYPTKFERFMFWYVLAAGVLLLLTMLAAAGSFALYMIGVI